MGSGHARTMPWAMVIAALLAPGTACSQDRGPVLPSSAFPTETAGAHPTGPTLPAPPDPDTLTGATGAFTAQG